MQIIIYHSKAVLPYIKLNEVTLVVQSNKEVVIINSKIGERFTIVENKRYLNMEQAHKTLTTEDFRVLLYIMSKNYLMPAYLVSNNLVSEEGNIYFPKAPDSRLWKHNVDEIHEIKEDRSIASWSEIVVTGPRPPKVKPLYKPGTIFTLEDNLWVLVKTRIDLGTTSLLCIKGSNQGKLEEYLTNFINELYPVEVIIEVV